MKWINCPNCQGEITNIDTKCAWCDAELKPKALSMYWIVVVVGLALWCSVFYFVDWKEVLGL